MDCIARAGKFLEQHGRDIDRARFAYQFAGGSQDGIIDALSRYQNPDGGFGNSLEPDIKAAESNPFATSLAVTMCVQDRISADHPVLQRVTSYLEETQDQDGGWRFSDAVMQAEMAPWFQAWEWPSLNPACVIAGNLKALGLGSADLHARVDALFNRLASIGDLLGEEFYALQPYFYYFQAETPDPRRELYLAGVLWWVIRQQVEGKMADAGHFFGYVQGPGTYTGRLMPDAILSVELDRLEGEQQEDGGWPSPYAEHWRGPVTLQNLLVLRRFGRV